MRGKIIFLVSLLITFISIIAYVFWEFPFLFLFLFLPLIFGGKREKLYLEERMRYCPNCGYKLVGFENYCPICGEKII